MTYIAACLAYRALPFNSEPYATNLLETASGRGPHDTDWLPRSHARSTSHALELELDLDLEAAIRSTRNAGTEGVLTSLMLPGFGRFELLVHHDLSHIAVRIHCDARPAYVWLAAKRGMLERRLAHAFGCPASVEVWTRAST